MISKTTDNKTEHVPVMTNEVLALLQEKNNITAIDCTLGTGGHTFALLENIKNSTVLSMDLDEEQINYVFDKALKRGFTTKGSPHEELSGWSLTGVNSNTLFLIKRDFMFIAETCNKLQISSADLIVFDLGFSTFQLKEGKRGIGYEEEQEELLDQRYSLEGGWRATDLVNMLDEKELAGLIKDYGEEKKAKEIARAIVSARKDDPIETNIQLSYIIRKAVGSSYEPGKHPAMRTFQALRIAVNNELVSLASALPQALDLIAGGSLAVITFNRLERSLVEKLIASRKELILKDKIKPSLSEVALNPRSHSAEMYVIKKAETNE